MVSLLARSLGGAASVLDVADTLSVEQGASVASCDVEAPVVLSVSAMAAADGSRQRRVRLS